jgi:hypothetical protein
MTRFIRNKIQVPGAHLGTLKSKGQRFTSAFQLSRTLGNPLLEGFVEASQGACSSLLLKKKTTRLILSSPTM